MAKASKQVALDEELGIESPSPGTDLISRHGYAILKKIGRYQRRRPQDDWKPFGVYFSDESQAPILDDSLTKDYLQGYVIARNGQVAGKDLQFRLRDHHVLVTAFDDEPQAAAKVQELIADRISSSSRTSPPEIRVVSIDIPIAIVERRTSGKIAVNLDMDEILVIDGILAACRHKNTWLPDGQAIDSRADTIRWLVHLIRQGGTAK